MEKIDQHTMDLRLTGTMNAAGETVGSMPESTLSKSKKRPAYLQSLNESEKQANFKVIENMNKKISFLKNPRHKKNRAPITMTDAHKSKAAAEASA